MHDQAHLSLWQKTVTLVVWGAVVAAFVTVGWQVMRPDDPLGAISLISRRGSVLMFVQACLIASVGSAFATLLIGRWLSDVGTFAASLGMGVVALYGNPAGALIVSVADPNRAYETTLAASLAIESAAWSLVVFVCLIVSGLVTRFMSARTTAGEEGSEVSSQSHRLLAVADAPWVSDYVLPGLASKRTVLEDGVRHLAIASFLGLLFVALLSSGLSTRMITHGQACFIVAASMVLACHIANRISPVNSPLWSLLAVPVVAIVGFAWAAVRPAESHVPAILPSSHFLRILPIQYIAVGSAAVIVMSWYAVPSHVIAHNRERIVRRPASAASGRAT